MTSLSPLPLPEAPPSVGPAGPEEAPGGGVAPAPLAPAPRYMASASLCDACVRRSTAAVIFDVSFPWIACFASEGMEISRARLDKPPTAERPLSWRLFRYIGELLGQFQGGGHESLCAD